MPDCFRAPLARIIAFAIGMLVRVGGTFKVRSAGRDFVISPLGRWSFLLMPTIAGGAPRPGEPGYVEPEDDDQPEPADLLAPAPEDRPPSEVDDETHVDNFDRARAMRTIRRQREAERRERERADRAEARLRELEDAQLSEKEKAIKDADEAKAEAQRQRDRADKLAIDGALRDAAIEAGVDRKRISRALRLVERDDITINADGDVEGAQDAIDALIADIPELKVKPEPEPEDEPSGEPSGGAPDRRRKPSPLTSEQVAKLAKDDPARFNELFEAGKIPASALR